MSRQQRRWWNALRVEQGFKQRQILRVLGLAAVYVVISTLALGYLLNALPIAELPFQPRPSEIAELAPRVQGSTRTLIAWATLMAGMSAIFATATGLYFGHKMAGPIYRFKAELKHIEDGGPVRRIALRRGDDFQDVAHALNRALERVARVETAFGDRLLDRVEALDLVQQSQTAIARHVDALELVSLCEADRRAIEVWSERLRQLLPKLGDAETSELA